MASSTVVRHINERRVLTSLREQGQASRADLAAALGLQRSTLTGIVGALLEGGLVHEVQDAGTVERSAGRPAVGLALRGSGAYFAGLEIGHGTSTAIILDLRGEEVGRSSRPTLKDAPPHEVEQSLVDLLAEAIGGREPLASRLQGVGVAVPGIVDGGAIVWAPGLGWRDVTFGERLRSAFDKPVTLENDANAAASSEAQFGVGRTVDHIAYVLLDRGVGIGLSLSRALYRGIAGRAGEAGHIPLPAFGTPVREWTALEHSIGIDALFQICRDAGVEHTGLEAVVEGLREGDPATGHAVGIWEEKLAWLVSVITRLLAPELIVFGGRASAVLRETRLRTIAAHRDAPGIGGDLALSTFGVDAVVMGAASLPMSEFFSLPSFEVEQHRRLR